MIRRLLILISILLIIVSARAPLAAAQDDADSPGQSNADCEQVASRETIRGELLEVEELEVDDTEDDTETDDGDTEPMEPPDQYRAVIAIDDEDQREFLIIGKGDKLDIGSSYVVTINEFGNGTDFEDRVAYLGEDLPCASNSTIVSLGEDGITEEIDVSGFDLPSFPVTPRQVLIAFGGLALVAFIFREPRVNH